MLEKLLHHFLMYGLNALAILLAVAALCKPMPRRSSWIWGAAVLLGLAFVGRTCYFQMTEPERWGRGFKQLWSAGAWALEGKNPYTIKGGMNPPNDDLVAFIYPPSTLPFFELVALIPLDAAKILLTAINLLICLSLGLVARRALIVQEGKPSGTLSPAMAALLTGPVVLSLSTHFCLEDGHFSFLVTLALLAALIAEVRQAARPSVTAGCLAVASIKVQTMLPFLLLFLRRRDFRIWLYLGLIGGALLLAAGNPLDLPQKISALRDATAAHRAPGKSADNSLLNPFTNTMFGFEHVFYRLGMVDRQIITLLGLGCVLGLGLGLVYLVNRQPTLPRGACCSLVSLYSMLFIYHRLYDLSILILPLLYSASRVHAAPRPARWCYAWVIAAILLILNAPYGEFLRLQTLYSSSAVVRMLVLPSVTYLLLSAMVAVVAAALWETRPSLINETPLERETTETPAAALAGN